MRLDVPLGNCIAGNEEALEERRFCKICDVRMLYKAFDRVFVCPKCGDRIDESKVKPKTGLVSVESESLIYQPISTKDEELDISKCAKLVSMRES